MFFMQYLFLPFLILSTKDSDIVLTEQSFRESEIDSNTLNSTLIPPVAFTDDKEEEEDPFFGKVVPKKEKEMRVVDSDSFWDFENK